MSNLSKQEQRWLESILSCDFQGKSEIVQQIENATIIRDYTRGYLSMKFDVDKSLKPVSISRRVPVEMRVYKKNEIPLQFLLHIVHGYVDELEIFYADSSEITSNIDISDAELEFITD